MLRLYCNFLGPGMTGVGLEHILAQDPVLLERCIADLQEGLPPKCFLSPSPEAVQSINEDHALVSWLPRPE